MNRKSAHKNQKLSKTNQPNEPSVGIVDRSAFGLWSIYAFRGLLKTPVWIQP